MRVFTYCMAIGGLTGCFAANASQIDAVVVDTAGVAVSDAVIALIPPAGAPLSAPTALVAMDQVKKQFVPHVLAIQAGTQLTFPNSDNIRHQVYSFSDAKHFELKLYAGKPAAPVLFDQPGVVVLGCNIHDWMSAYVYVVPTPFFAVTDVTGHALIQAPNGDYAVKIWHPRLARGRDALTASIKVTHPVEVMRQTLSLAATDDSNGLPPPPNAPQ